MAERWNRIAPEKGTAATPAPPVDIVPDLYIADFILFGSLLACFWQGVTADLASPEH